VTICINEYGIEELWSEWYDRETRTRPILLDPMKDHIVYNPEPCSDVENTEDESE